MRLSHIVSRTVIASAFLALFSTIAILVAPSAGAATVSSATQASAGFWWDDDQIIFSGVKDSYTEAVICQGATFDGTATYNNLTTGGKTMVELQDEYFRKIGECLKRENGDIPKDAVITDTIAPLNNRPANLPDSSNYHRHYTFTKGGIKPIEIEYYCEFKENNSTSSYESLKCLKLETAPVSWTFFLNGYDANGEAIFINTDYKDTVRVYTKDNVVKRVDVDYGKDKQLWESFGLNDIKDYEGKDLHGTPGITFQQSATRYALESQKPRLETDFYNNCQGRARAPSSGVLAVHCLKANGSFETLWRTCAVVTGNAHGDLVAARNCLKVYAGVELDIEAAQEEIPADPTDGKQYTCNIDMIGYIICPLTSFMAGAADGMFNAMQKLLHISPLDTNEPGGKGAYAVWAQFRNIANVLFVIAILAIALSQVSNYGITNYGAKKALPKLILGAIILNISFFICAILLDASNILGDSLHAVLGEINNSLPKDGDFITAEMGGDNINSDGAGAALNWTFLIGAGLAGIGAVVAVVMMFVPILAAVIIALLVVVTMLLARHALIIILTIAAPIALACYMLPNTKQWFSKWQKAYITMLFMYPAIALIFGLSTIAANVILQIGTATESMTLRLFALAIQAAPLMITPLVMKLGGQTLGNVGSFVRNNGMMKGMRSSAGATQGLMNNSFRVRALKGKGGPLGSLYRRSRIREAGRTMRKSNLGQARAQYVAEFMQGKEGSGGEKVTFIERAKQKIIPGDYTPKTRAELLQSKLGASGGDSGNIALAYAENASLELLNEEAKAHMVSMKGLSDSNLRSQLANMQQNGGSMDESYKLALIQTAFSSNDEESMNLALQASGSVGISTRKYLVQAGRKSGYLGDFVDNAQTQQALLNGDVNSQNFVQQVIAPTVNAGELSANSLQSFAQVGGIDLLREAKSNGHLTPQGEAALRQSVDDILSNDRLKSGLEGQVSELSSLR